MEWSGAVELRGIFLCSFLSSSLSSLSFPQLEFFTRPAGEDLDTIFVCSSPLSHF